MGTSRFCSGHLTIALVLASAAYTSQAQAQAQDTAAVDAEEVTGDEIVVTAQRRTERLQDVPISVAVLTPQITRTQGIVTTLDLQRAVPGLVFQHKNLNGLPYIRGIGAGNTAGGDEPGVSLYVDGVYRASSAASTFSLPNVDQIEVLKGPQGTLFGRNAIGGVINIVTKDPSDQFGGRASLGYGNFDTFTGTAYVTGPIAQNLSANLSGRYENRADGWGTNVATGEDVYTKSSRAIAGKLKLDLGDTVAKLSADWGKDRWNGGPGQPEGTFPGQGSQFDGVAYYAGFYNVNSDTDGFLKSTNYGASLQVEHDFGALRLRSITAYRRTKAFLYAGEATPNFNFDFTSVLDEKTFTQEAHLLSNPGSKINWIAGAFFLDSKPSLGPSENIQPTSRTRSFSDFRSISLALFGQVTAPLGDSTNLTVGARYTIDEKNYTFTNNAGVATVLPERTYKRPTWRLALDHKFTDDIMVYGSYSRGFKSGSYGSGTTFPAVSPATVDAFEVGLKAQFLDGLVTFNLAAFYSKYKNIQVSATVINVGTGSSFLQLLNAASSDVKGFEAELVVRPTRDLRLSGNVSVLDAEYISFKNAPSYVFAPNNRGLVRTIIDASGRTSDAAPALSATVSATYVAHSSIGDIEFSASDSYMSKYYLSIDHLLPINAKHLLGASIQWTSPDERWGLQLWGNNLANKKYVDISSVTTFQLRYVPGAPRTYGITATAKF